MNKLYTGGAAKLMNVFFKMVINDHLFVNQMRFNLTKLFWQENSI